jgi:hypothetical protein
VKQNGRQNGRENGVAEVPLEDMAQRLAGQEFDELMARVNKLIAWEKKRIETQNRSEITALKARGTQLVERRVDLQAEIRQLGPIAGPARPRGGRVYYWLAVAVLFTASVFFAHLSLAPFGLGWEAWALAVGMGIITAILTDLVLEKTASKVLIWVFSIGALAASITGIIILAHVRGDILALYLKNALSMGDGAGATNSAAAATFYERAIPQLRWLMGLLAVSMELGCGICLFEARKQDSDPFRQKRLERAKEELDAMDNELVGTVRRLTELQNEAEVQEAVFYRQFYLGLFERIKQAGMLPVVLILLFGLSLIHAPAVKAQSVPSGTTNVVVAIDLTESVAGAGYDGRTDYQKDIDATCELIGHLPAGARFAVIAITDHSFSEPYILLQGQLPRNKGTLLFEDRVAIARNRLASKLRTELQAVKPRFRKTDILGAFVVAADILRPWPGRKVLVVLSDMRQATGDLNLERPPLIAVAPSLRRAEALVSVPSLAHVEVYALGVDAEGKSVAYWRSLRDFWTAYFSQTGATLRAYSVLRDLPDLAAQR